MFGDEDTGPFYVPNNHQMSRKYNRTIGEWRTVIKNEKKIEKRVKIEGICCERACVEREN